MLYHDFGYLYEENDSKLLKENKIKLKKRFKGINFEGSRRDSITFHLFYTNCPVLFQLRLICPVFNYRDRLYWPWSCFKLDMFTILENCIRYGNDTEGGWFMVWQTSFWQLCNPSIWAIACHNICLQNKKISNELKYRTFGLDKSYTHGANPLLTCMSILCCFSLSSWHNWTCKKNFSKSMLLLSLKKNNAKII